MNARILALALAAALFHHASAQTFIAQGRTLYLAKPFAPLDDTPGSAAISPDGATAYFVRPVPDPEPSKNWEGAASEICRATAATGRVDILVRPAGADSPEANVRGFSNLTLSPDGRTLYFLTAAWATSGGIHALDLASGQTSFVSPGNDILLVQNGEYKGDLIVQKHKYYQGGGSYDYYWIVTPAGKELTLAGETRAEIEHYLH